MVFRARRAVLLAFALVLGFVAPARGGTVTPGGPGARSHFAPQPAAVDPFTDGLARRLFQTAAAAGRQRLVADPRLVSFAELLARALPSADLPGIELQEALLSHYGIGEPPPHIVMVQVAATDGAIHDRLAQELAALVAARPFTRVGIGVHRRFLKKSVVIALQSVDVEMLPVPRALDANGSAFIAGRVLRGLGDPRVLVSPPSGEVRELPVRSSGDSFQTTFRCEGIAGRHQIEITAVGALGKTIVANFPAHCGVSPPTSFPLVAIARAETQDRARAEAMLLEAVNRDRAARGLTAVALDEGLGRVARAYSEEMAARQSVRHVSVATGNAADRVRRAGVPAVVVLENVGRARSIADAQRSFMTSPGHRANVLDRGVIRIGVGIAFRTTPGGVIDLYVTQLFAR